MVNWNNPTSASLYTDVLSELKERDTNGAKLQYTSDTNIPEGAIRYNRTSKKIEEYLSSSWEPAGQGHEAPVGSMLFYPSDTPPTGWLICNGQAVSRTTYADLFTLLGTTFGTGDGSTTFNVPDARGRFALAKSSSGTGSTIGATGGSLDHTHTIAHTHEHDHTHTFAHTHTVPTHRHTIAHTHSFAHTHTVPGHYHGKGSLHINYDIGGGTHFHYIYSRSGSGWNPGTEDSLGQTAAATNNSVTTDYGGSGHGHDNAQFDGAVGNTSGSSGDSNLSTNSQSTSTTGGSSSAYSGYDGGQTTNSQSTSTTSSPNDSTTGASSAANSGATNPAFIVPGNMIIKY